METVFIIIAAVVGIAIGFVVGKMLSKANVDTQIAAAKNLEEKAKNDAANLISEAKRKAENTSREAQSKADSVRNEAENAKKDKMYEAKEHFLKLKEEHTKETVERERVLLENESKLKGKEQSLNAKIENYTKKESEIEVLKEQLNSQIVIATKKKEDLDKAHEQHIQKLEQVAQISAEDAKAQLVELLKEKAKTEAMVHVKTTMEEAQMRASKEAKKTSPPNQELMKAANMKYSETMKTILTPEQIEKVKAMAKDWKNKRGNKNPSKGTPPATNTPSPSSAPNAAPSDEMDEEPMF